MSQFGALLADPTRAEVLCALMDGRAHTGSELARHVGVAPSTMSEHLSKLLDASVVVVEPQGRHRYFSLANPEVAQLLEMLGANTTDVAVRRAPAELAYARTCYDHLAGELAVAIYDRLLAEGHLIESDEHLTVSPSGFELFQDVGVDVDAIRNAQRSRARSCLDWTERRHHLAGAAGTELLSLFLLRKWLRPGRRPRSIQISEAGRHELAQHFGLQAR